MPQDPLGYSDQTGDSEFSWGPNLVPLGRERARPEDGGMYRGTTPRRGRLSARDRSAPGHPGDQIAG